MKTCIFLLMAFFGLILFPSHGMSQEVDLCELTQCTLMDKQPQIIKAFPPKLTPEEKERNVSGMVIVRCVITKEGKPNNISIVESDPPGFFDESVLKAVNEWEFSPALKDGVAIDVCVELPITLNSKGQ